MGLEEGRLQRLVKGYCLQRKLICWKFTSTSNRGVPDLVIIGLGKVLFMELKSTNGHLSALQVYNLQMLDDHGMCVHVCDDFNDAKTVIDTIFTGVGDAKSAPDASFSELIARFMNIVKMEAKAFFRLERRCIDGWTLTISNTHMPPSVDPGRFDLVKERDFHDVSAVIANTLTKLKDFK